MSNQETHTPSTEPSVPEPVKIEPLELEAHHEPVSRGPARAENSTDATRGEPLAMRARERRADLLRALDDVALDHPRVRRDIEAAVSAIDALLTGDDAHLTDATAAEINRWLESSKHLGERAPNAPIAPRHDQH